MFSCLSKGCQITTYGLSCRLCRAHIVPRNLAYWSPLVDVAMADGERVPLGLDEGRSLWSVLFSCPRKWDCKCITVLKVLSASVRSQCVCSPWNLKDVLWPQDCLKSHLCGGTESLKETLKKRLHVKHRFQRHQHLTLRNSDLWAPCEGILSWDFLWHT